MIVIKKTAFGSLSRPRFWSYEVDGDSVLEYLLQKNGSTTVYKSVYELSNKRLGDIFGLRTGEFVVEGTVVTEDTDHAL